MRSNLKPPLLSLLLMFAWAAPLAGQMPSPPAPKGAPAPSDPTAKAVVGDLAEARRVALDRLQAARQQLLAGFASAEEQIMSDRSMSGDAKVARLRLLATERDAFHNDGTVPETSEFVETAAAEYRTEEASVKATLVGAYKEAEHSAKLADLLVSLVTARQSLEAASCGTLADAVAALGQPPALDPGIENPKKADPPKKPKAKAAAAKLMKIQEAAAKLAAAKPNVSLGQGMMKSYVLLCALEKNCKEHKLSAGEATAAAKDILEVAEAGTAWKRGGPPAEYQALIIKTLQELLDIK